MTTRDTCPVEKPKELTLEKIRALGRHTLSGVAKKANDISPIRFDPAEQLESE